MFEVKVKQEIFLSALEKISKTVGKEKEKQHGFAKTLYMETVEDNGAVKLKMITSNVSDLSEIIIETLGGTVGPCEVLVEFDKLYEILNTTKKVKELDFSVTNDNNFEITYTGRKNPISFAGISKDEFVMPPVETIDCTFDLPIKAFKDGVDKASSIIHENSSMKKFNNIALVMTPTEIKISGYDSTYLIPILYKIAGNFNVEGTVYVECARIKKYLSSFDVSKPAKIEISKNNLTMTQDNLKVIIRLSGEDLPNFEVLFKQQRVQMEFEREEMLAALKRIEVLCEGEIGNKVSTIVFNDTSIDMSMVSKLGSNTEHVPCTLIMNSFVAAGKTNPVPFTIPFNIKGLKLILESLTSAKALASFVNSKNCIIHASGTTTDMYKCIIPSLTKKN